MDQIEKTLEEIIEGLPEDLKPEDQDTNPDPATDPAPDPDPNPADADPEPDKVDTDPEPAPEPEPDPKTNSDFAKIRAEHNAIARLAKAENLSVEDYVKKIRDELAKAQAEKNNVPEEFQKKFNEMEQKLIEIDEREKAAEEAKRAQEVQAAREDLISRLDNLKTTFGLDEQKLIEFGKKARDEGYPIAKRGYDLVKLYKYLNPTDQTELENQMRQRILKEMQEKKAPSPEIPKQVIIDGKGLTLSQAVDEAEKHFKK